jgi:hypothetical protein
MEPAAGSAAPSELDINFDSVTAGLLRGRAVRALAELVKYPSNRPADLLYVSRYVCAARGGS